MTPPEHTVALTSGDRKELILGVTLRLRFVAFQIFNDLSTRIQSRRTGDAATGMRPRAAQVQSFNRRTILCPPNQRTKGEELIELAERKKLKIMVDHTFLFTGAVKLIEKLIGDGTLGKLYYYDSTRVNLGLFQHDVNVIWDLAAHDLAIMNYLIKEKPQAVVATGEQHLNDLADIAFLTIYYPSNIIGHVNVNWLSPVKVRTTLIGGEKKMLIWNDLEADEKIKVYDKGVAITSGEALYQTLVSYRTGDMWAPRVEQVEALKIEAAYFVDCILDDKRAFNDGIAGLEVVRMLEAADRSLQQKGKIILL